MRRPIELRKGRTAWAVLVAPDGRIPAHFWGAYRRPTFNAGLALVDEVIAAGAAFMRARAEARAARERVEQLGGGD